MKHAFIVDREGVLGACHRFSYAVVFPAFLLLLIAGCKEEGSERNSNLNEVVTLKPTEFRKDIDEQEAERLQKNHTYAKRSGKLLELVLSDGKTTKLTDFDEPGKEGEWVFHRFVDYLRDIDCFLVREHYYEGLGFVLVNRKYGSLHKLDVAPQFSPNRKHFITVAICDAHCPNRLQVWRRREGGDWFEMVWSYSPYEDWGNTSEKWLDDKSVEITVEVIDTLTSDPSKGKYNYVKKAKYLRLQSSGWNFTEN